MSIKISTNANPSQQLLDQVAAVDTAPIKHLKPLLESFYAKCVPEQISIKQTVNDVAMSAEYIALGREKVCQGRVALLIMAGGAATRLGASCPKGTFPVQNTCLFEILLKNALAAGAPDVIILLSAATAVTEEIFASKGYFGYEKSKISFVYQSEYPVVSDSGEILAL